MILEGGICDEARTDGPIDGVVDGVAEGSMMQVEPQKLSKMKFSLTLPLGKAPQTVEGVLGHAL